MIAVIVAYKVDRLTRALSDIVKIIDVLNAAGAMWQVFQRAVPRQR
nr:hypothetical protein [Sphingomonas sp. SRS2]